MNMYLAEVWRKLDTSMRVHVFSTFFFSQLYSKRIANTEELDKDPIIDYAAVQRWVPQTL